MKKIKSYTTKSSTEVATPELFSGKPNMALLAQALHVYRARKHPGNSRVQTRGEVSLTKAKVYRQKGTGNARHGAKSAPIFVGGGKAHGPKGVKRVLDLPLKMRRKALESAYAHRFSQGKIVLADLAGYDKTQDAAALISNVRSSEGLSETARVTVAFSDKNKASVQAFSNLAKTTSQEIRNLNAYTVYFSGLLILDRDQFETKSKEKAKKQTAKK